VIYFTLSNQKDLIIMKKLTIATLIFGLISISSVTHAASCINGSGTSTSDVQVTSIGGVILATPINSNYCSFVQGEQGNAANDTADTIEAIFNIEDPTNGIDWSLVESSYVGGTSGTWTYTGTEDLSSPFVVVLKSSISYAAYLFNDLSDVNGGSFVINFLNAGGQNPDVSHINIYKATGDFGTTILGGPDPVPLPAALWLFAPALLGLMGFRRKTKS